MEARADISIERIGTPHKMDHIIRLRAGGQDNIENLQLLCAHCNRVKGHRPQEYLVARLRELGIAAKELVSDEQGGKGHLAQF